MQGTAVYLRFEHYSILHYFIINSMN